MAFFSDTFTDTDAVQLQSHAPNVGTSWTRLHGSNATVDFVITSNRANPEAHKRTTAPEIEKDTGGAFDARGLSRPYQRIVYRIGEIGDPKMQVRNRTVSFKQAAGFGGRVILTTTRPALHEILWFRSTCGG